VPLGAFLSGGVDSSAIVAMMAGLSKEPVNSCSIAFDDPAFDESVRAPGGRALQDQSPRARPSTRTTTAWSTPWPTCTTSRYADSSAIPTYRVCQLARKRVTVALSGDGGDENFAGYRRYRMAHMAKTACARCPLALRKPVFGFLGKPIRRPTGRRACSAPRPPSRRWRATWSRATSTACRC
jgi:asparagine synthase (glutamine-hydrolysing)